ncbi:MAG: biotin--[acetyl-CoA-carboxylase] ligase [Balneola sp.]|nr:biotin--[acetyl-CoA-carboxylase] ligase [Balneola sp.]
MFDTTLFESKLATSWLGRSFSFFEELPSTNSLAKKREGDNSMHGTLILTDYQSGGRGQYDRKWTVDPGKNLTFSIIFEPKNADRLNLLTLACALAVQESLEEIAGIQGKIKWPNDILIANKKICGILTETVFIGNRLDRVVVGIGLNVAQTQFPGQMAEKATSVCLESNEAISREELLAHLLQRIEYKYRQWTHQSKELVKEVNGLMRGVGKWCDIEINGDVLEEKYKFLGVNESGEFLAMKKDLDVQKYTYQQIRVLEDPST